MANTKISEASAASALGGTEVVGGVQGGANAKITIDQIKTYCLERKQVMIDTLSTIEGYSQSSHIVRLSAGVWYVFYCDSTNIRFFYRKSSDYGVSWEQPVQISGNVAVRGYAIWFDGWTPNDAGTAIHIAYFENTTTHDVLYRRLNSDVLGSEITVFNGASASSANTTCISVTKAEGGKVHVAFDIDTGVEIGHYVSDAATPTSFSTADGGGALQDGNDYWMLFPANTGTTADICALYMDRSAAALTLKTYNSGTSAWSESATITTITNIADDTVSPQFCGAVRKSDGHLIALVANHADNATADLECWDITNGTTFTQKTNIITNTDDFGGVALCIDVTDGATTLYAFNIGKSDGTETAWSLMNIYVSTSSDGGATWSSQTKVSLDTQPIYTLKSCLNTTNGEYAVQWVGTLGATGNVRLLLNSALT